MSLNNSMPSWDTFATALSRQGVGMTPTEMHGLISGTICGGKRDSSWKSLIYTLTNDGMAFSQTLTQLLQEVYQGVLNILDDDGFLFTLYLPESENITVFDRADALAGWVNHFLLGLGVTQPGLDKVTGETGEAIDDLRTIALLGYDESDDEEELARSLEEVIEYVRVAALLCHDTFSRPVKNEPEIHMPTLH